MFIKTAKQLNEMLGGNTNQDVELLTNMHIEQIDFYLKNKDIELTEDLIKEGIDFIEDQFNIILSEKQFIEILNLFPFNKIDFAVNKDDESLFEVAFNFFAGSEAPVYGDNIESDEIFNYVTEQAKKLGYKTH